MAIAGRSYRNPTRILRVPSRGLANTAGGQADETVVSAANSEVGGSRWDTVSVGADATLVFDDLNGRTWYRHATGATTTQAWVGWAAASVGSGWPRYFGRLYFTIPAAVLGTTTFYLFRARSGSTQSSRISVSSGNRIQLRNTGNSAAATGAVAIAADTIYRLEWDVTVGAAAPGEVRVFAGDATTPLETISVASADFGTGLVDELGFGIFTSTANHPEYRMRGFQVNNSVLPGPLGDLPVAGSSAGADAVTVADAVTRVQALVRATADSVTVADAVDRGPLTGVRELGEAVTVADSVAAYTVRARDLAEAVTVADTVERTVAWARAVEESVTVADAAASSPVTGSRDLAEAVTVADSVSRGPLTAARAVAETVAVADTLVRSVTRARALAEAVEVADAVSATGGNVRNMADAVQVADTVARIVAWARGTADGVTVADAVDRMVSRARVLAETLEVADAAARGPLTGARALAEAIALGDTVSRLSVMARDVVDAVQLVDAVAGSGGNARAVADAVTVADSVARSGMLAGRGLADAVTVVDVVARVVALQRLLADAVSFADAAAAAAPPSTVIVAYPHSVVDTGRPATIRRTV